MKQLHFFKNFTFLFILLAFFSLSSCEDNSENTNDSAIIEQMKELKEVAYGTDSNQKYDIYLPSNRSASKTKVIVLIHGGGWVGGDKADMKIIYDNLKISTPEYAIVNINYRLADLSGKKPFPMQTDDIRSVIEELKNKSNEYGILSEFAFVGASAGAHLSMLYAYKYDTEKRVKVVCDVVGPTDFLDASYTNSPNQETQQVALAMQFLVGKTIQAEPDYFKSISPKYAVTAQTAPTILFYGGVDNLVPEEQGIILKQKLDEANVANELYIYPQDGHGFSEANTLDAILKTIAFIRVHLK